MNFTRRQFLGTVPVGAGFLMVGCSTGTVTEAVNAVVVAASFALSILEQTGTVPPDVVSLVQPYLASVGQGVIDTNTELQSMDTDAVKAAKVAQIWATLATGLQLPPGTPLVVVNIIQEVVAAIKALLSVIEPSTKLKSLRADGGSRYKLTSGDKHALGNLTKQAMQIKQRASALHK